MKALVLLALLACACGTRQATASVSGDMAPATSTTVAPLRLEPRPTPTTSTTSTTTTAPPTTTTTTTTPPPPTTLPVHKVPGPTLTELIELHFDPEDWQWAHRVAMCESSATGKETFSSAVNGSSGSTGWYQHLPKFWEERSTAAGVPGASMFDPAANVIVAAYLFYDTPQGAGHWYPSESCWTD